MGSAKKSVFLIITALFLVPAMLLGNDWKLKKNTDGIKVYTCKLPGSHFKSFRAIMQLKTTTDSILAVFNDIENFYQWIPNLKEVRLLKQVSPDEIILYQVSDLPWPVADRDTIYRAVVSRDKKKGVVTVKFINAPRYLPEKKGLIRVKKLDALWIFRPDGNGMVSILYEQHADAGGKIPAWIINAATVKRPVATFRGLKKMLLKQKYINAGKN